VKICSCATLAIRVPSAVRTVAVPVPVHPEQGGLVGVSAAQEVAVQRVRQPVLLDVLQVK
jgi:hypothetical protein